MNRDAFASGRSPDGDVPEAPHELHCATCGKDTPEVTMSWHECTDCAAKRADT